MGIPEQFKDALKELKVDYRNSLLHLEISTFTTKNSLTIDQVYDKIRKLLTANPNIQISEQIKKAIFLVISVYSKKNSSDRESLLELSKALFTEEVPLPICWLKDMEFDWEPVDKLLLKIMASRVNDLRCIDNLQNTIAKKDEQVLQDSQTLENQESDETSKINSQEYFNLIRSESLKWLTKLILLINEKEPRLLNEYNVFPNQYGNFVKKMEVFKDLDIADDLKDIKDLLSDKTCREELLLKDLDFNVDSLFDERYSKSLDEFAKEVDEMIIKKESASRDKSFIAAVQKLLNYIKQVTDARGKKLFEKFYRRKPEIMTSFISDDNRNNILEILKEEDKIHGLAVLAEDPSFSPQILKSIILKRELILSVLDMDEAMLLSNSNLDNVSTPTPNESTGFLGEEFVNHYLKQKYQPNCVQWMNCKDGHYVESYSKFDFRILDENGEIAEYYEVKATSSSETNPDQSNPERIPFYFSKDEINFIQKLDPSLTYYLVRVFNVGSPNIHGCVFQMIYKDSN